MEAAVGGGELAALGGSRDVGAVDGDDLVEDVARFVEVVAVGDDEDGVVLASAGEPDLGASAGCGGRDEFDPDGGGVALHAVLGSGVAEPDMVADVVGG